MGSSANTSNGMIAVDKIGTKVLFLNPVSFATEVVLDGFPRTVHELLVVPDTGLAYVPIFGDGIHGRNPNPGHLLCIIDLQRARPCRRYRPHTLHCAAYAQTRARRHDLHHLREQRRRRDHRPRHAQGGRCHRFRVHQRPSAGHLAGWSAALHRERGGRHGLGDRSAGTQAARQNRDTAPARRHRDLPGRPDDRGGRRRADLRCS